MSQNEGGQLDWRVKMKELRLQRTHPSKCTIHVRLWALWFSIFAFTPTIGVGLDWFIDFYEDIFWMIYFWYEWCFWRFDFMVIKHIYMCWFSVGSFYSRLRQIFDSSERVDHEWLISNTVSIFCLQLLSWESESFWGWLECTVRLESVALRQLWHQHHEDPAMKLTSWPALSINWYRTSLFLWTLALSGPGGQGHHGLIGEPLQNLQQSRSYVLLRLVFFDVVGNNLAAPTR